ncbi:MAG: MATE family efflux transporter, partial [Angelakisella sp.]
MTKNTGNKSGMTDMTVGSPLRLIVLFSLPLLAGNILQQLYNMVDSMVVGQYVGTEALAAVGTGFPIFFMVSSVFMGIGMGATVIISQYYGAGDMDNVRSSVDTVYTAMMLGCIPITLFGLAVSGPLLRLINVPPDAYELAHTYLLIVFLGVIAVFGYNVNAGILQGLGDSKTPLIFLSVACVLNIILDLVFVIAFDWGVAGVAIATAIAQGFSWIFGIFYINRKYPEIKIHPFSFRFNRRLFKQIFRMGIPISVQQALFSVGVMAMLSLINGYGSAFVAGFNGANKLDTFVFMPITSFASACTTFVGQNIGAGKLDRVHKGTVSAIKLSVVVSLISGGLLLLFGTPLMGLFNGTPEVIAAGMAYLNRIV